MPEFTAFLDRFRHDLGKRYSVAHQHTPTHTGRVYVLVRRRGAAQTLAIVVETRWIAALALEAARGEARVEYKHLAVLVRRFFDNPTALAEPTFVWPGTQESREALRRALDPRLAKRS